MIKAVLWINRQGMILVVSADEYYKSLQINDEIEIRTVFNILITTVTIKDIEQYEPMSNIKHMLGLVVKGTGTTKEDWVNRTIDMGMSIVKKGEVNNV